ncbi:HNH endonuclease [Bdellovibrio bacteriovorus]|uniref:HNH endonuclease n=1 Tax=Bdellovibrio bacteriovorus TaxID=959 RepID=UPI003AA82155
MQRLIHKQQFACAGCGVSFEDQIRTRIRRIWERENALGAIIFVQRTRVIRDESHPESKVSYYQIGDNTGHIHQADHIIPIHKGGAGIDPRNLQILCVPCHKAKTIKERMA